MLHALAPKVVRYRAALLGNPRLHGGGIERLVRVRHRSFSVCASEA
jgi:hypothetical protein